MSDRQTIRRIAVLGLLLLIPVSGMRTDWKLFRCRFDHIVRLAPCCPEDEADDETFVAASDVTDDGCCDVSVVRANQAPFASSVADGQLLSAPLVMPLPAAIPATATRPFEAEWYPLATTGTGPPVFLRTRALLI